MTDAGIDTRCEVRRVRDRDALGRAAAGLFARLAGKAAADQGRFCVALSGGSTPKGMLNGLSQEPLSSRVPWDKVELFFVDERCVPPDHGDSNFPMVRELLLSKVPIPEGQVHRMEAEGEDQDRAARDYQAGMAKVFGVPADGAPPSFDLIFLGMGTDGHTASLFPHTDALKPTERWVVGNHVPQVDAHRMTFTPALINRAACVTFLVEGEGKAERLAEVLEGPDDPDRLPSQRIRPERGRLIFLADRAAALRLKGTVAHSVRIAPSILAADFALLGEEVRRAEEAGADRIHVDVMDGNFVPNISIGPPVVKSLRRVTRLQLDTHLMITDPDRYVESFAKAGSDAVTFHQETVKDWRALVDKIRGLGMGTGVTISPPTPVEVLDEIIPEVDLVLIMTVHPGFGGQKFMSEMMSKVAHVREIMDREHPTCDLQVDGGIYEGTIAEAVKAGARLFVAGSAVFRHKAGIDHALQGLLRAAAE